MKHFSSPEDLLSHIGQDLGVSPWRTVNQATIDAFARDTGDDNWIHVDTARAARELPGGKTIAHGFLTLALTVALAREVFSVGGVARAVNYGVDGLRFTAPVPADSRIRLRLMVKQAERRADGAIRVVLGSTVEVDGQTRPAAVFDKLALLYPEPGAA
ncbi:MAG: MaoC family dehydratase [Rhodospirillaceae bacterium]|nr:MaoC family dehydratase [Rhodospirillaceae bacterium]